MGVIWQGNDCHCYSEVDRTLPLAILPCGYVLMVLLGSISLGFQTPSAPRKKRDEKGPCGLSPLSQDFFQVENVHSQCLLEDVETFRSYIYAMLPHDFSNSMAKYVKLNIMGYMLYMAH